MKQFFSKQQNQIFLALKKDLNSPAENLSKCSDLEKNYRSAKKNSRKNAFFPSSKKYYRELC